MREYIVSDLTAAECETIESALKERGWNAGLDGLYWLPVPSEALNDLQKAHTDCAPHVAAIEVGKDSVRLELLIRAKNRLRCDCVSYAEPAQTARIISFLHKTLSEMGVTC